MSERLEAKKRGDKFFFTETPCVNCQTNKRYTSSGICIKCGAKNVKEWKLKLGTKERKKISNSKENAKRANEAKDKGEKTFIPEMPCWKGHQERYVSSRNCVECQKASVAKRLDKNKLYRIRRLYGLIEEEYNELVKIQNGKCKICGKHESVKFKLHIDHCHDTKKVRGLLCMPCNQGLGLFKHSTEIMQKAIKYLKETEGE